MGLKYIRSPLISPSNSKGITITDCQLGVPVINKSISSRLSQSIKNSPFLLAMALFTISWLIKGFLSPFWFNLDRKSTSPCCPFFYQIISNLHILLLLFLLIYPKIQVFFSSLLILLLISSIISNKASMFIWSLFIFPDKMPASLSTLFNVFSKWGGSQTTTLFLPFSFALYKAWSAFSISSSLNWLCFGNWDIPILIVIGSSIGGKLLILVCLS